jgi:hypothetical protein
MFAKPQVEHQWLEKLIGDWEFEHVCTMPDGTRNSTPGRMTCRSLGGMWLICESSGESDGSPWSSMMTVGFDPTENHYVGTFIGSMMSNIWHYRGLMDPAGTCLPLESHGPRFFGTGTCSYRDTIEIIDHDTWMFTSEFQDDDGTWVNFMSGKHTRV